MPFIYRGVEFTDEEINPETIVAALLYALERQDERGERDFALLCDLSIQVHGKGITYGLLAAAMREQLARNQVMRSPEREQFIAYAERQAILHA